MSNYFKCLWSFHLDASALLQLNILSHHSNTISLLEIISLFSETWTVLAQTDLNWFMGFCVESSNHQYMNIDGRNMMDYLLITNELNFMPKLVWLSLIYFSHKGKYTKIRFGFYLWTEERHSQSCWKWTWKGNVLFDNKSSRLAHLLILMYPIFCALVALQAMSAYGYEIVQTLIVDIEPDSQVKRAMNEINAG